MPPGPLLELIRTWEGTLIASDESGYGSCAGPLVVCAAAAPRHRQWTTALIRDSKKLEPAERETVFEQFWGDPDFTFAVETVSAQRVDAEGAYTALRRAHERALVALAAKVPGPVLGIIDGNLRVILPFDSSPLVKADDIVPTCSLASIIAKVTHDRIMRDLDKTYPGYGFAENNGYHAEAHLNGLRTLGPCPEHRRSYASVKQFEAPAEPQQAWELFDDD